MSSNAGLFNANQKFLHIQNFGKFILLCIIWCVLENCFVRLTFSITLRYKTRTYKKLEKIQADQFLIFWYIILKISACSFLKVSFLYAGFYCKSGSVGYNNKILVTNGNCSLGKSDKVNTFELERGGGGKPKSYKTAVQPTITHKTLAHKEETVALILLLTGGFTMWFMFQ